MTPEEIMIKVANDHSYETWDEMMNDCHPHSQIEYTKEAMELYTKEQISELEKRLKELSNTTNDLME